jgi:hypothetical protein
MLLFVAALLIVQMVLWFIRRFCYKTDVWHPTIGKLAFLATIEIILMNVTYFALSQLNYGRT